MTNWASLISDLRAAGMSRPGIAKAVNSGVSTIQSLEEIPGREPRHALGNKLIKLQAVVAKAAKQQGRSRQ